MHCCYVIVFPFPFSALHGRHANAADQLFAVPPPVYHHHHRSRFQVYFHRLRRRGVQRLEDGSAVPDGMLFQILLSTGNDETSPLYHHHHRRTIPVNPLTDGAARIPEWGGISTLSTEKVLTIKKRTNSTTGASLNSGGRPHMHPLRLRQCY